jgi:hypothetical protein
LTPDVTIDVPRRKRVFGVELARENAGGRLDARTIYDSKVCFAHAAAATDRNLKSMQRPFAIWPV